MGVPSERMIDPTQSIIHGLKDAKIKAELAKAIQLLLVLVLFRP